MNDRCETGVRLEFSNERPTMINVVDMNRVLATYGSRIWSLDVRWSLKRACCLNGYKQDNWYTQGISFESVS
jgi:hypothetical protein